MVTLRRCPLGSETQFPGPYDAISGQRYYSPNLGRFINRDPIQEAGGANLYGFCGNDAIDNFDVNGNSWLSKLWDHTILKIGQQAAINWDHQGRMAAEMVAVVVASYFGGEALASAIYTPAGAAAGGAAAGAAGATASGAAAGTAASGWLAGSVAAGTLTAGEATTIAVTAGGAAGGFIGGTLSGVFAGENFGQTMRGAFESAGEAAAFAFAGSELLNARPIAPSWSGAEGAVVTSAARYGVNAFAEKQLGINGWEFDAGLEAISYLGYKAFGDPYSREAQGNQGIFSYIGGFGDRNSRTGWFLQSGGLAHYAGEFLFDVNDQLLQWQGLPDAGGIARAYHGWALPQTGHSLGASRLVTMASLGLIDGGTAVALPFGEVAPGGVQTLIGSGDIIPGSYGGLLFNPEATTGSVPFITGHMLTQYVKAFPNL